MTYYYPKVQGGYRWNLIKRCLHKVGIEPVNTSDIEDQTCIEFDRDLSDEEKTNLDALMLDNPTKPPASTCRVKIQDIWEKLAQFNANTGLNIKIYYSESNPGSGVIDTIELHTDTPLTLAQKTKITNGYGNLLTVL